MTRDTDADAADLRAIYEHWGDLVANVDFTGARALFRDDVMSFGTFVDIERGVAGIEKNQWRNVWGTIEGFHFNVDALEILFSPDRLHATTVLTWGSTGIHEDGSRFPRNGRATTLFTRDSLEAPWLIAHLHFSLNPKTPQKSHGNRPERLPA